MKIAAASPDPDEIRAFLGWLYAADSGLRLQSLDVDLDNSDGDAFIEATVTFDDSTNQRALALRAAIGGIADVARLRKAGR